MTLLELDRKTSGLCKTCAAQCSETSVLCERHRLSNVARQARHRAMVRGPRRLDARCVHCNRPSTTYRHKRCGSRQLSLFAGTPLLSSRVDVDSAGGISPIA